MFQLIGAVCKYSLLVVVVLVLSHIVEIQGVTISQHVLKTMHWVSGYSPKNQVDRITVDFSKTMQSRISGLNKVDTSEFSHEDQQALNKVIEKSQFKRK